MLKIVQKVESKSDADLVSSMLSDRKKYFVDKLKWNLCVDSYGHEIDRYDAYSPVYVILHDNEGEHIASTRLMPMNGANMTTDYFAHLMGSEGLNEKDLWESTRFLVTNKALSSIKVACSLMLAGSYFLKELGVERICGVTASLNVRKYWACGWKPSVTGQSNEDDQEVCGCVWDISDRVIGNLERRSALPINYIKNSIKQHRFDDFVT